MRSVRSKDVVYYPEEQQLVYTLRDVPKTLWVLANEDWASEHLNQRIDRHDRCAERGCEFTWVYDPRTGELVRGPHHIREDDCTLV